MKVFPYCLGVFSVAVSFVSSSPKLLAVLERLNYILISFHFMSIELFGDGGGEGRHKIPSV